MDDAGKPDIDELEEPRPGHGGRFVPADFRLPKPPRTDRFWLEPLGPQHNDADYAAWGSSIEHILATPGFQHARWPHPMPVEENLSDLVRHAEHFRRRLGFTYTVRDTTTDDVLGCVYIYPDEDPNLSARVRSWVRASHADLDLLLAFVVQDWLDKEWPFTTVRFR